VEIRNAHIPNTPVTTVLFDFDGTLSTLRHNWEAVMQPLMVEYLGEDAQALVEAYIDESTGIQTIHQMKWLAEQVQARHGTAADPWAYKAEYNRRLMQTVALRREALRNGSACPADYLIAGSGALLKALADRGVALYVASGTDEPDVKAEAQALGLAGYFAKIAGAPPHAEGCSKEGVMRELLGAGIPGERLAVVGDGKVEIAIGRENRARTLGVAGDEATYKRLVNAGADVIIRDFTELDALLKFFMGV